MVRAAPPGAEPSRPGRAPLTQSELRSSANLRLRSKSKTRLHNPGRVIEPP